MSAVKRESGVEKDGIARRIDRVASAMSYFTAAFYRRAGHLAQFHVSTRERARSAPFCLYRGKSCRRSLETGRETEALLKFVPLRTFVSLHRAGLSHRLGLPRGFARGSR